MFSPSKGFRHAIALAQFALTREFILRFLVLAVPIGIATAVTIYVFYHLDVEMSNKDIVGTELHHMEMRDVLISQNIRAVVADVRLLAKTYGLDEPPSQARQATLTGLTNNFLLYCGHYPQYERLRLVDGTGRELVRVVCRRGSPYAAPAAQLGRVRDLDMVRIIRTIQRDTVYISEISMTHSPNADKEIPAISFIVPLTRKYKGRAAYVVLGVAIRDIIPDLLINTGKGGTMLIVRRDGRYLHKPVEAKSWGATFAAARFNKIYPDAWDKLWKSQHGIVRDGQGLFAFSTLVPVQIAEAGDSALTHGVESDDAPIASAIHNVAARVGALQSVATMASYPPVWKIVSHVPAPDLAAGVHDFERRFLLLIPIMLILPLIGTVYLANLGLKRARAVHDLEENERYLRDVTDTVVDGIATVGTDGRIERSNAAMERLFGYSVADLLARDVRTLFDAQESEGTGQLAQLWDGGAPAAASGVVRAELTAQRSDGSRFPAELVVSAMDIFGDRRLLCIIRDISERRALEAKQETERILFFHQTKMAEIGLLAARIIHEVGNPIAAIHGLATVVKDELGDDPPAEKRNATENLDIIVLHAERLSAITRDITDFVRQRPGIAELFDLNAMVRATARLIQYDTRWKKIDLDLALDDQIPAVHGVQDQIAQVLMNLLVNASDAVQVVPAGERRVSVSTAQDRHEVVLSVADNGQGMNEETRRRAFDSFFTTKPEGQGTGLGLALCHNIVTAHGGTIEVVSTLGQGATFHVHFPIRAKDHQAVG